jgi:hypothetical protein
MMLAIIRRHNALNGLHFSLVEFGLIALLVGAFAVYYLLHHETVMALITVGITFNCLPVVILACHTLLTTVPGERVGSIWNRQARAQHLRENPYMLRDTLVLTGATLLPFVSLLAVLSELVGGRLTGRPPDNRRGV